MKALARSALAIGVILAFARMALGGVPGTGPDEAAGVNNRRGDASPAGGFTTGETNSRIDDYFYQDEQINLDKDSGVVKVLRVNQKNLVNDFVVELIPLTNPKAMDIAREIRNAFRLAVDKEGGRAEVLRDKVKNQALLYVVCPRFQLPYIRQAAQALDVPWIKENQDGFAKAYYVARNRAVADVDRIAVQWCDGEGQSDIDTANNAVLRREEPMRTDEYLAACKAVDIPANQIILEGAIYEVNTTNDLKLGLDFIAWKNGPGRNLFNVVLGFQKTSEEFSDATSVWSPVSQPAAPTAATGSHTTVRQKLFSINYLLTAAFLDFLAAKGKARVVARPKIVARSNQVATFTTTDQILAFNIVPDEVTRTAISPQTADVGVDNRTMNHSLVGTSAATTTGLSLTVLPFIGLESTEVSITVEYRTIAGTAPQGTPIINTRTIVTRARVRDGEPLVLGGLKRSEKVDRFQGIPFLSRIKYLGLLFGGEEHSDHEADFVVVLTPRVVVAGESDMATVEDVKTQNLVLEKEPMEIPSSPWGFDQWLLDKES